MKIKWVKLKKYIEITGDSSDAVHAKRRRGDFIDDIHCKIGPDGNLWINPEAVEQWVEQGAKSTLKICQTA